MGEGWETARRRDDANDWVEVRLMARGVVRVAELDTTWFLGNAPGEAALSARDGETGAWTELLPRTPLLPDTRHRFVLDGADPATDVRLDVYPDGGMARLRLWGSPHRTTGWPTCASGGRGRDDGRGRPRRERPGRGRRPARRRRRPAGRGVAR